MSNATAEVNDTVAHSLVNSVSEEIKTDNIMQIKLSQRAVVLRMHPNDPNLPFPFFPTFMKSFSMKQY